MTEKILPRARLFCPPDGPSGTEFLITESATIGRDPGNQIVLSSRKVAKREARIAFDSAIGSYWLEILGSGSTARLDGMVVKGKARLGNLNVITFAEQEFIFVRAKDASEGSVRLPSPASEKGPEPLKPEPAAPSTGTLFTAIKKVITPEFLSRRPQSVEAESDTPAPAVEAVTESRETDRGIGVTPESTVATEKSRIPIPRFRRPSETGQGDEEEVDGRPEAAPSHAAPEAEESSAGQPFLVVKLTQGHLEYPLSPGSHLVGRSEECDVRLEDSTVSRRHALLEVAAEGVTVKDLESVNYTFLRDQRVTSPVTVPPGSTLRFGSVEARIVMKGSDE